MNSKTKANRDTKAPPIIQKDLLQRIHFSHQASIYLESLAGSQRKAEAHDSAAQLDRGRRHGPPTDALSSLARDQMRGSKRLRGHNQLKLDPSFNRTICSECHTVLVPGLTSRIRNRPHRNHINVTHHTCLQCSHTLTLPSPPTTFRDQELDGPSRRSRNGRAARQAKVVFFDKEGDGGHALWQGPTKVEGWGQTSAETPAKDHDEKNTA